MKRIIYIVSFLIAFTFTAFSQDKVKVGISFSNSEYNLNLFEAVEYTQGISASLNAKIASQAEGKGFRLGGEFYYKRNNFDSPTDTYAFGPILSYRLSIFEPFALARFGFNTTYNSDRQFTRSYGAGVDINLGHIYVRPFEVNWERQEGFTSVNGESAPFTSPASQTFNAGIGVRF